ncbi:nucleoside triphosphate hydrolase [Leucobacter weissii]|uniref:Nucleoside triphosphate hydrolase n=1 Tax=Leucobacter weissii TaxID=1983706 RepID=A0A939SBF7_9MICO|nr:MazG nucleotide pyrophosphohydrolase domain-containing protein [Leucobacter weissii]MBO1902952.1 nucleoside triphosphate hydrolase [Leucobacter weissii]
MSAPSNPSRDEPESTPRAGADPFAELRDTVHRLVWPEGCAWHAVQTHESLVPYLIEETAEFVDAVERGLPPEEVAGELGDVLYQVLFHAAIAERDGEGYDFAAVAAALNAKLIGRHPHVFGDRGYMSVEELNAEWERLKEDAAGQRRGSRGALDGIPVGMPALARAAKVVERLRRAGAPVPEPGAGGAAGSDERELGDALLALVIRANAEGVDPDRALRLATQRLAERHPS